MPVRILAWNVNHRSARRAVPSEMAEAIAECNADVVTHSEYVIGPDHGRFPGELAETGLSQWQCTGDQGASNQILTVARTPMARIAIDVPPHLAFVPHNLLGMHLPALELDVFSFRMPMYKGVMRPLKREVFEWLLNDLAPRAGVDAVVAGDFNTAAHHAPAKCGDMFARFS